MPFLAWQSVSFTFTPTLSDINFWCLLISRHCNNVCASRPGKVVYRSPQHKQSHSISRTDTAWLLPMDPYYTISNTDQFPSHDLEGFALVAVTRHPVSYFTSATSSSLSWKFFDTIPGRLWLNTSKSHKPRDTVHSKTVLQTDRQAHKKIVNLDRKTDYFTQVWTK